MSGLLGKAAVPANVYTDLYTVPAGKVASATVSYCNRTAADITVRLAVRNAAIADADYLEFGAMVPANGVLERGGIALSAGEIITVRASAVGISARAHGFVEAA